MLGVVKLVPVCNGEPPVAAAYQFIVAVDPAAVKFNTPGPHRSSGVVEVIDGDTTVTWSLLEVHTIPLLVMFALK